MSSYKKQSSVALSLVIIFALIMGGCSSTDSNSDTNSNTNGGSPPPSESFTSGTIPPDGTFSHTFENEGEVEYYCNIHSPDMQGKITVSSSAEAVERDTVVMRSMSFDPAELTVAPNTEVVWVNEATTDHTVYQGNPPSGGGDGGGNY